MSKKDFEFGPFHLSVTNGLLLRHNLPLSLSPKVFDTLVLLIENRGRLVGKDEIMEAIWQGVFVEERNLAQNIFVLRKVLGECESGSGYIQTVPKRGYRFVAPVKEIQGDNEVVIAAEDSPGTTPKKVSVAVLPFRTLNLSDCEEHLGVGLADALITRLSRLKTVVVRPTSAVIKYFSSQQNAAVIGQELRVNLVIEGSLQKLGDRVRARVQIVNSTDGNTVWAELFDEKITDIFELEDRISERVAAELSPNLTDEQRRLVAKRHTESTQAYHLYMKGRYVWNRRTFDGFKQAIEYFDQAIEIDPNYAQAHAGLADCYIVLATYSLIPSVELGPKASAAATRALEIDEHLVEAHASLGLTHLVYNWDWAGAESQFKRALALNDNYATAHQWYGLYLAAMGRPGEAIREAEIAHGLDPLSLIIETNLAWILYFARQHERSIEQCLKVIELESSFWRPYLNLGWCYIERDMLDRAITALAKASSLNDAPVNVAALGRAYALAGEQNKALEILDNLKGMAEHRYVSPYYMAEIYLGLGENEKVLECLEKSYDDRVWFLAFLKQEPMFDGIRTDSRFQDLEGRLGLRKGFY